MIEIGKLRPRDIGGTGLKSHRNRKRARVESVLSLASIRLFREANPGGK